MPSVKPNLILQECPMLHSDGYLLMIWEVWVFFRGCWFRQLQCTKQTKMCFRRQSRVMSKRKTRRWKALLLNYTLRIGSSSNFIKKITINSTTNMLYLESHALKMHKWAVLYWRNDMWLVSSRMNKNISIYGLMVLRMSGDTVTFQNFREKGKNLCLFGLWTIKPR